MDNGSSVDIIYLSAFQQLKVDPKKLRPFESPLVSFSGQSVSQRHSDIDSHGGVLSARIDSSVGLPGGRLSILIQCDHWEAYAQSLEGSHVHLLPEGKIPNRKWCM